MCSAAMDNYRGDYYDWLLTTALAVEDARFEDIDRFQLAEELRDMGRAERRGLRSQIERIMVHLLKIRCQPLRHGRSWDVSIDDARLQISEGLEDSPSLRREIPELMERAYRHARNQAAIETGLDPKAFPEECPFSMAEVLGGGAE